MAKHVLVLFFSRSKHDKLDILLAHLIHHIGDQVETFLVCQTGYDTDHKLSVIFLQSQFFLKCPLILDLFLAEILCIIILDYIFIRLRIVFIVIDAIYNTAQIM